ncbi:MAG: hypothetical protein ACI4V2_03170, partial [Alloprevotella sp.]
TALKESDRPIPGDPDFFDYMDTQEQSERDSYEELHKADNYEEEKGGKGPIDSDSIADDPDQKNWISSATADVNYDYLLRMHKFPDLHEEK